MTFRPFVSSMQSSGNGHIHALDGLRGIAAACVVYFHLHNETYGYLAVDFFFMLSGLVLSLSYEEKLIQGSMNFTAFLSKRIHRLYPMIVAGVFLGLAVYVGVDAYQGKRIDTGAYVKAALHNLLLVPLMAPLNLEKGGEIFPLDVPMWSLFFELLVNVIYALWLVFLRTRALAGLLVLSFATLTAILYVRHTLTFGYVQGDFLLGLVRTLMPFLIGILIYRSSGAALTAMRPYRGALSVYAGLIVILTLNRDISFRSPVYDLLCVAVAFPILLVMAVPIRPKGRMLELCRWAGGISYPLYVLHFPIVKAAQTFVLDTGRCIRSPMYDLAVLLLCTAASWLCLKCYDEPIRHFMAQVPSSSGNTGVSAVLKR